MKKMNFKIAAFAALAIALLVGGCKKDDDSMYQLKGDYQPKGNYQPAGNYGNANIVSNQFTVTWTLSAPAYYCTIYDGNITQSIVDNGSVEVYMSNGSGGWIALPYTMPMSSTYASTYTPVHYLGGVTVWKYDTDYTQASDPGTTTFKVVCVSYAGKIANPNLNWNDYNEVKNAFNLKD
ncbi:MAG: hypothetical protein V2A54_04775 [Bacteroidota bacterium]